MTKHLACFLFAMCLGSCLMEEKCLDPDCYNAGNMRFNLINSAGKDLVFDSTAYQVSEIKVIDLSGREEPIQATVISGTDILVVDLLHHKGDYQLLLKGTAVDTFKVSYKKTQEECCGETFWVDDVQFNLPTGSKDPNIGAIPVVIE